MMVNVSRLPMMSPTELDNQPHGIIQVDDQGTVKYYNRWESQMSGVSPDSAVGRNFFTQVAPCTNNRLVFGRFKSGVGKNDLNTEFNYTFTYRMKPTNVRIQIYRDTGTKTNWILVAKK